MAISEVTVGVYDITIYQGTTFARVFTFKDRATGNAIDLTTVTSVAAKIRDNFGTSSNVIATFTAAKVGTGDTGQITLSLTATTTAGLSAPAGTPDPNRDAQIGYYDVELTDPGGVYRYMQGAVYISREATK